MRFGLKESIIERILAIFSDHPLVKEVVIYGSRAKGCAKPGSDIDLTLKGEQLPLHELNKISLALDDLLLPYTFDLSVYQNIDNPELLKHIERVGKIFYKKTSLPGS